MKKIAILGPKLDSLGGVNSVILNLKKGFNNLGFEVHLFPVGKSKINESEYIHPINSNNKHTQYVFLKEKLKFYDFDLVMANNLRTHYLISELNLKKSLYVFHQGSILQKKNFFVNIKQKINFKKIYRYKTLIFSTNCYKEEFLKKFRFNFVSDIIPNPFDIEFIRKKADEFEVNDDYILGVGRFTKGKNFEFLIKAYKNLDISSSLFLLGEGEEKNRLKELVYKYGIEKKVKFLEWKENPFPYIKNAKLLVHPSKFESFGNVLVESLILKTPVVATNIKCGPSDILIDELSSFLVKLDDINNLSDKILLALHSYPPIEDKYIRRFDYNAVVKQYAKYL